jgi:hypothetical protein
MNGETRFDEPHTGYMLNKTVRLEELRCGQVMFLIAWDMASTKIYAGVRLPTMMYKAFGSDGACRSQTPYKRWLR